MAAKSIPLTQGYSAIVDEEDYEFLSTFKWRALVNRKWNGSSVYAVREVSVDGKPVAILMHRLIAGCKEDVDHHDGNGLNNQRYNLRPANDSQNLANSRKRCISSSRFKGVVWHKRLRKWQAAIAAYGVRYHIGSFKDEVDAATAYNFKAFELFGEFARMNTPSMSTGSAVE